MTQATGSRPTGVTILAILAFISGVVGVLGGLAALGLGVFFLASAPLATGGLGIVAIFAFILAAASIALGAGFWLLKSWAWPVGVVLEALSAISALLGLLGGDGGSLGTLVIALAILWYLHQPHVRAAFGARTTGFPVVGDRFDRYIPGGPKA